MKHDILNFRKEVMDFTLQNGIRMPEIVCVSKTFSVDEIYNIYLMGERCFGENKVQELVNKISALPRDIKWQFIGTLQSNKLKQIVGLVDCIQSVDRLEIADKINKIAESKNIIQNCMIQINISSEKTKHGFTEQMYLNQIDELKKFKNIHWTGLMGIASIEAFSDRLEDEFLKLKELRDVTITKYDLNTLKNLSMGMSNDWQIAMKCGSTMIRVGTAIFGKRNK